MRVTGSSPVGSTKNGLAFKSTIPSKHDFLDYSAVWKVVKFLLSKFRIDLLHQIHFIYKMLCTCKFIDDEKYISDVDHDVSANF